MASLVIGAVVLMGCVENTLRNEPTASAISANASMATSEMCSSFCEVEDFTSVRRYPSFRFSSMSIATKVLSAMLGGSQPGIADLPQRQSVPERVLQFRRQAVRVEHPRPA